MYDLPEHITIFYFLIAGFFFGWAMPRGKYLKSLQLKLLKALHNFFADEQDYIQSKVERIRKVTRRKK
jgi:hypothetical protein